MRKGISIHIGDAEHYGSDRALRTCGKDHLIFMSR